MRASANLLALLPFLMGCQERVEAREAQAAEVEAEAARDNCSSPLASNLEYTECWQSRAREAEAEVEVAYARALQVATSSDEQETPAPVATDETRTWLSGTLEHSQADWAEYSNRQCLLEGRVARGGTGTRALVAKCQYRLNRQRASELEAAIGLIEGNS